MNLPFFIAKRYLFSKKSKNIINIISIISIIGVATGTLGLVVSLSVFNGFDGVIRSLFSSFDPDLKITAASGKSFSSTDNRIAAIRKMEEVAWFSEIIEENALLRYGDRQYIAKVKGIDSTFREMSGIASRIINGEFLMEKDGNSFTVLGQGVAYFLSLRLNFIRPLHIYVPKKGKRISTAIGQNFNHKAIYPSGIFSIQQELDDHYILVPITLAREIFEMDDRISAIELKLQKEYLAGSVKKQIRELLGPDYVVNDRYEQHADMFKIMQSEKFSIFLILSFILIIASFNIIGSLTMLILEKKNDINVLKSMGADDRTIKRVFLFEGWSISILGAFFGLSLGGFLCWLQMRFGFVKLGGGGSFIIDAYPVEVYALDLLVIFTTVTLIGFCAAWLPVRQISGRYLNGGE